MGKVWKFNSSIQSEPKENWALNEKIDNSRGYGYDIKNKLMTRENITLTTVALGKRCIAMIVVQHKSEFSMTNNEEIFVNSQRKDSKEMKAL